MDIKQRRNEIADRIIQAFAALPAVQELIPEGQALHVKAIWDPKDKDVDRQTSALRIVAGGQTAR